MEDLNGMESSEWTENEWSLEQKKQATEWNVETSGAEMECNGVETE